MEEEGGDTGSQLQHARNSPSPSSSRNRHQKYKNGDNMVYGSQKILHNIAEFILVSTCL